MKYDICALGNALVDTQYMVSYEFLESVGLEADQMTLVSAEEQNEITKKLEDLGTESVSDCGGSATNSLVASSSYGAECHHVCRVSKDDDGLRYLDSLKSAGVYHKGYSEEELDLPTGKCLILVTPDAKRTMVSMLGVSACMSSIDLDLEAIANSKIFYIEGYMVTSDENFNAVLTVLEFLKDKDIINTSEYTIEVIHTPGHASNHFCFLIQEEECLLTGDHIMNGSTVVIAPPDGNMTEYLESLKKLDNFDIKLLAPGHGDYLYDPKLVTDCIFNHRLTREEKVLKSMQKLKETTIEDLLLDVYDDVDPHLHPIALWSLEAHLIRLEENNLVTKIENTLWRIGS
ncbi:PfkB family carbohydrate kinase [Gammaproteobacteria bacterium]|nr:PfkB family carbohydrate kinase [Gammaproteobacteria bacterium]